MKITVIGGTGYAGKNIVNELASREHEVTSMSRNLTDEQTENVKYIQGSALSEEDVKSAIEGSDVVVASLSPRGELEGKLGEVYASLATSANRAGARLIVVGGFGTLKPVKDAQSFLDAGQLPAEYEAEAKELADFYVWLSSEAPDTLDWTYVAPAAVFGAYNPGKATGNYRVGGDVAVFDEAGNSDISGADFALAVTDEIENPTAHKSIISFAY